MSLDLHKVVPQIEVMADQLQAQGDDHAGKLARALAELHSSDAVALEEKRRSSKVTWLVPGLAGAQGERVPCPPLPPDFAVLAVDGSHIDVSRHAPARCYLINLGRVVLRYGPGPEATLTSDPRLFSDPEELVIADPQSRLRDQPIEGPLLGVKRGVQELQALADLAETLPPSLPTLALLDGSLVLWSLAGQAYPDFVKRHLLYERFLPSLERLRTLAQGRPLALVAYVSLPRSTEVVNALRLQVCPYQPANCDEHCGTLRPGERPCDVVGGLLDRDIFSRLLQEGERSALFTSHSSVVTEHYGEHQVHFFYLHAGPEIARVEVPAWIAREEEPLALAHALAYDQCRRGLGYPVAIAEAHEQAVVTGPDRQEFARLVEEALGRRRLPVFSSEKERSKRVRWL